MAISDKATVAIAGLGPVSVLVGEGATIAALAWRLGGWVWAVAALAMVCAIILSAFAFCKAAKSSDPDGADDWWGEWGG